MCVMQDKQTDKVVSERALHVAARCWTDDATASITMDSRLAEAFARRLDRAYDLLESSWAVICHVDEGFWAKQPKAWQNEVMHYCADYFSLLDGSKESK